jgi:hypothetical protein
VIAERVRKNSFVATSDRVRHVDTQQLNAAANEPRNAMMR